MVLGKGTEDRHEEEVEKKFDIAGILTSALGVSRLMTSLEQMLRGSKEEDLE